MVLSIRGGRATRAAFAVLGALALAGCATVRAGSYLERGADFERYKTYDWGPPDRQSTGDPRLDNNPFFEGRVRADVERELAARGFEKTLSGRPDVHIHYHANVSQRFQARDIESPAVGGPDRSRAAFYDAGTLVVDVVDARTSVLVWRGWAEDGINGAIDNQEWMERKVDRTIARILKTFPRHL